jgi:hypothetical protein
MRQDAGVLLNFLFCHRIRFTASISIGLPRESRISTNDAPKQATNIGFVQPEIQGFGHNFAPPGYFALCAGAAGS